MSKQKGRLRRVHATCPQCRRRMRRTEQSYHYVESGLSNVYLHRIAVYVCQCGEEVVELPAVQQLHVLIVERVLTKAGSIQGDEFRFMRKFIGLKAVDIAKLLEVEPGTVSRWETEKIPIGGSNEKLFRFYVVLKLAEWAKQQTQRAYDTIGNQFLEVMKEIRDLKTKDGTDQTVNINAEDFSRPDRFAFYPFALPDVELV